MTRWHEEHRQVSELNAWQQANAFAMLLHEVCSELTLGQDKEWLLYLLQQAGPRMREAVAEGWNQPHLAECLFNISEALTSLALIDYYLLFLRHEGYLTGTRAAEVSDRLNALQEALETFAERLRETLRSAPEAGRLVDGQNLSNLINKLRTD